MPTFKLPKFGISTPSATVEVADMEKDVEIDGGDMTFPEEVLTVDIEPSSIHTEGPSIHVKTTETDHERKGKKFKMPGLGFSRPDINPSLSQKDVDVTLPDAEVKLPDVELKEPSADAEIKAPEIKVKTNTTGGSPSKFNMPTFKLPKFGISTPSATVEVADMEKDVKIDGGNITLPEEVLTVDIEPSSIHTEAPDVDVNLETPKADVKSPEAKVEVRLPKVEGLSGAISTEEPPDAEFDANFKKSKFSLPRFSFSKTSVKEAEISTELPHVDISLPEGEMRIKHPDLKPLEGDGELDVQGGKFKLPKFDISLPEVKGPEIDLSLSKKDVDVPLPEAKAEVQIPDAEVKQLSAEVEIKAPEIEAKTCNVEGSPSKFKMPTITVPKFEAATQKVNLEVTALDKSIKIEGENLEIPKNGAEMHVTGPSIDTEGLSVDVKAEPEDAISVPDTTTVEVEAKSKRPNWTFRKFSFSRASAKAPDVDVSLENLKADVKSPEAKVEVCLPEVEVQVSTGTVSIEEPPDAEFDANFKKSKFSLPRFSFSKTNVKEAEISTELPHIDISLPEGEVKVKQPGVEMKAPEHEAEHDGQPSKFKLTDFGIGTPSATVEVPDMDKGIKIDGGDINIPEEVLTVDSVDVNVTLPEAKTTIEQPEVELKESLVEIKGPGIDVGTSNTDGSQSKFKMPTFKFPKFGVATPKVSMEIPDVDKDTDNEGAKLEIEGATVDVTTPSIDTEDLSVDVGAKGLELEGSGSKFKRPNFGISMPEVKGPEIEVSVSEKDADVSLPEAKAEAKLPSVNVKETEGAISGPDAPTVEVEATVKRPNWAFRKFSFSRASATAPDVDVNLETPKADVKSPEAKVEVRLPKVEGLSGALSIEEPPDAELCKFEAATQKVNLEVTSVDESIKIDGKNLEIPKDRAEMHVTGPSIDTEGLSVDVKAEPEDAISVPETTTVEVEAKTKRPNWTFRKFSFSRASAKAPDVDVNLETPKADVKSPEAKVEVRLPKVEGLSGALSIEEPPDAELCKFEAATQKVNLEVTSVDESIKIDGKNLEIPKDRDAISVPETTTVEVEAKTKRPNWTFRKFSFSRASAKAPDVDVNLETPKADVKSPEAKVEVCIPEVEGLTGAVSIEEPPDAEFDANIKKSKFSLPRFSFSKTSVKEAEISTELPHVDISLPEGEVKVKQPGVEMKAPEHEDKHDGQPSKFKLPYFGFGTPSATVEVPDMDKGIKIDGGDINIPEGVLTVDSVDVNVTLPEAKATVELPEVELKESLVEIKGPGIDSKFKMPTFKFPKFGAATPKVSMEIPDVDKDTDNEGAKLENEGATVDVTAPSIDTEGLSVDVKAEPEDAISVPETTTVEVEAKSKRPNWTIRKFSFSRASAKAPDVDVNLETPKADVKSSEAKVEVRLPEVEVQGSTGAVSVKEPSDAELKVNLKKSIFSLPRFSFSKSSLKGAEVSAELLSVDVSLPEEEVKVKLPGVERKAPEHEAEHDGQPSKFKLPNFSIALPKAKEHEEDLNASKKDADLTLLDVKEEVKLPEIEVISSDTEKIDASPNLFAYYSRALKEATSYLMILNFLMHHNDTTFFCIYFLIDHHQCNSSSKQDCCKMLLTSQNMFTMISVDTYIHQLLF
uniref:Uncharacterized protein n=1 Tax=Mola mola TaxID=94237 RepID=A0A3Q3XRA3_MOLML